MTRRRGFCYHTHMDNFAALEWQWQMGATDFVAVTPRNWQRGTMMADRPLVHTVQHQTVAASPVAAPVSIMNHVDLSDITELDALRAAIQNFEGLDIKKSATQMVFGDGVINPRVVVIGEAPGAEEDRMGRPFVGAAGQLLDKMLASIGLSRGTNSYITNVVHWRPPGNRQPTPQEIALSLPYLQKHIELLAPEFLLVVGGTSAKALFNIDQGITRVRGQWFNHALPNGKIIPALVTFHPAYLLRAPAQKALAWQDLLALKSRLHAP